MGLDQCIEMLEGIVNILFSPYSHCQQTLLRAHTPKAAGSLHLCAHRCNLWFRLTSDLGTFTSSDQSDSHSFRFIH